MAAALSSGGVVALGGVLGAGKTRLVQAIARASGVDPRDVVSPTFVLMHEYHGAQTIYHIDAYRLHNADEFLQMGGDEAFGGECLVLIEWAERVAACLPDERLQVSIRVLSDDVREFVIAAHGPMYEEVVKRVQRALASSLR